jgi:hypothetical protein
MALPLVIAKQFGGKKTPKKGAKGKPKGSGKR